MKKIILLAGVLIIALQAKTQYVIDLIQQEHVNFYEVQREAEKYFEEHGTGKGSGYKLYQRWAYMARRKMKENGDLPSDAEIETAYNSYRKKYAPRLSKSSKKDGQWEEMGPFDWTRTSSWSPGLGRIVSIAVEETNQDLIFAGSPGGGLWKSTDAGESWTPLGDEFTNMNIWSLAIDPDNNNTVYYGNTSGDVYKSTDGGLNWNQTGNQTNGTIKTILINPDNTSIVFAVSTSGIYRSTNGGNSWTRVSTGSTEDIVYKPGSTSVMYSCGGQFRKSTDGGVNWTTVSNGFVSSERMKLDVTPAEPNWVYLIQKAGSGFGRIYRSQDEGNSFSIMSDINSGADNYLGSQASRDMAIGVSTTNANEVHIGGLNYYRSRDGGATFSTMAGWSAPNDPSYVHADIEVMEFIDGVFYVGTDGGIFRSTDNGENMDDLTRNGLAVAQYYRLGNSQTDENMVVCGAQDNGTLIHRNDGFVVWLGADGMECFIDHTDADYVYGTIQYGGLYRSSNGGDSYSQLSEPGNGQGSWVTPFEIDPVNASTIYVGYANLHRSTNRGNSWTNISQNVNFGGDLDEFKIAPSDNNYIYVAEGGDMWVTTNGQAANPSWTDISSGWSGSVNYISVDPNNAQHLAIATSSDVYESFNAGSSWSNIGGNLPNLTAECVLIDDTPVNGIYVGMDRGVYYTNDNLAQWEPFMDGLANADVRELEIQYSSRKIRAATYGRGIWQSDLYGEALVVNVSATGPTNICNGESVTIEGPTGANYTYQWRKDGEDIPGATNKDYVATEPGSYTLVADDGDLSGESQAVVVTIKLSEAPSVIATIERCGPGEVTLEAASNEDGELNWYADPSGGNVLETGDTYVVDVNESTSFYVDETDGCTSPRAEVQVNILEQPPLPQAEDVQVCSPGGNVDLTATGSGEELIWYDAPDGGEVLGTGGTLNVDVTETSSYYVAESTAPPAVHGAAPDSAMGGGNIHGGGFYLVFELFEPVIIESAVVYAEASGSRTFELRNENGEVQNSVQAEVGVGATRVDLNIEVGVGIWQIGSPSGAELYRNNEGVEFPYPIGSFGNVTASTATSDPSGFYYYLYDWIVRSSEEACEGPRKEVMVSVDICSGTEESGLLGVALYPNPANNQLKINVSDDVDLQLIRISNEAGDPVYESREAVELIDLRNFASGVYFVELFAPNFSTLKRIVID